MSAEKTAAEEQFARGKELFSQRDFEGAAAAFTRAYSLAPHPSVLFNIGLSYDQAGDLPAAVASYRQYLKEAGDTKQGARVRRRLDELMSRVGELDVRCSAAECEISIDGTDHGRAPLTVILAPGEHRVEAFSGKELVAAVNTRVAAGAISRVELYSGQPSQVDQPPEPAQPVADPTEQSPPVEDEGPTMGIGFWIASGITVAAGATTIIFGARALNDLERFEDSGRTDEKIAEEGERDELVTNIMIGVTAATAATACGFAIYDIWFAERGEDERSVTLAPGPGLGIEAVGRF
jgi:tetratricopeptide (TPR) repeat protein